MTTKEIAEKFGLSVSTISKALNGSSDISEETRKAVCEYANSVGYRTRKSMAINGRIAVLWARGIKTDSPLSEVCNSFRSAAERSRYVVVTDVIDENFDLNEYLAYHHLYGALILDLTFSSPVYAQLKGSKYPVVLLDNYVTENELVSGIGSDNTHAVEQCVEHLVSLGHSDIAFIGGERASLVSSERFVGYIMGLARNGLEYRYDLVYFGDYSMRAGEDAAEYFLENKKEFSAIVCASDVMAMGFINRMRKAGKRIPEDYSVIGYDDLKTARDAEYDLTTVRQDFDLIGERAFRILENSIKGFPSQRATIDCTLVQRSTTCEKPR